MDNMELYLYGRLKNYEGEEDAVAYIEGTVTRVVRSDLTKIGKYGLENRDQLEYVNLPNVTVLEENAFYNCTALKVADFGSLTDAWHACFGACTSLEALIIRMNAVCGTGQYGNPLPNSWAGYLYVPDELVESYKSAYIWSNYESQIKGLSEIPEEVLAYE